MNGEIKVNNYQREMINKSPLVETSDSDCRDVNIQNPVSPYQYQNNQQVGISVNGPNINQQAPYVQYEPPASNNQPGIPYQGQQNYYPGQPNTNPNQFQNPVNSSNNNQINPMIVNTQVSPNLMILNNPNVFKSESVIANCPSCKNISNTRVQTEFSWSNCCCCFWFGPIIWIIFQAARDKDINCNDASHYCNRCGNIIHSYKSC